jgi:hypothetical protein
MLFGMDRNRPSRRRAFLAGLALSALGLAGCGQRLGYGLLLWSVEQPPIAAGTVVPVYIKSNIDKVWVVGVVDPASAKAVKIEVPLWQLELVGSKGKANARAAAFADLALAYAETMQDGLPVRAEPDNAARRVYRLRQGQLVKILAKAEGPEQVGVDGPLAGEWLQILTDDGVVGFSFSNRLRRFEHAGGPMAADAARTVVAAVDPDQEKLFGRLWYPDNFRAMLDDGRVDLSAFNPAYGFFPGQDTGIVRIELPGLSIAVPYTGLTPLRAGVWRFEGTNVQAALRGADALAVQFNDPNGQTRTQFFTTLPVSAQDVVDQETARREALFQVLYKAGPVFRSENYGILSFTAEGGFAWTGYDLLVPRLLPADSGGVGRTEFRLFLDKALAADYDGALSLRFDAGTPGPGAAPGDKAVYLDCFYKLDGGGLRLELIPANARDGLAVTRRGDSPSVIYFARSGF